MPDDCVNYVAQVLTEIHSLPGRSHDRLYAELSEAASQIQTSGDTEPFRRLLERIHASAAVRRDPYINKYLAEADAEAQAQPDPKRLGAKALAEALGA